MNIAPCRYCNIHTETCHSKCEKYLAYRQECDRQRIIRLQQQELNTVFYSSCSRAIKKANNRKKH